MAHWIEGKGWSDRCTPRVFPTPSLRLQPPEPKKEVNQMIKTAAEVRYEMSDSQMYKNRLNNAISTVMSKIEAAAKNGERKIYFTPPADLYDDVRTAFAGYGYVFKQVGVEGGVWQDCEYICW